MNDTRKKSLLGICDFFQSIRCGASTFGGSAYLLLPGLARVAERLERHLSGAHGNCIPTPANSFNDIHRVVEGGAAIGIFDHLLKKHEQSLYADHWHSFRRGSYRETP